MFNIRHFPSMRQSIKLPIRNFINSRFLLTKKFTYLLHIKTFQRVAAIVILFSICQKENMATKYDKFLRSEFIYSLSDQFYPSYPLFKLLVYLSLSHLTSNFWDGAMSQTLLGTGEITVSHREIVPPNYLMWR